MDRWRNYSTSNRASYGKIVKTQTQMKKTIKPVATGGCMCKKLKKQ